MMVRLSIQVDRILTFTYIFPTLVIREFDLEAGDQGSIPWFIPKTLIYIHVYTAVMLSFVAIGAKRKAFYDWCFSVKMNMTIFFVITQVTPRHNLSTVSTINTE